MTSWDEFNANPGLEGCQRMMVEVKESHLAVLFSQNEEHLEIKIKINQDLLLNPLRLNGSPTRRKMDYKTKYPGTVTIGQSFEL